MPSIVKHRAHPVPLHDLPLLGVLTHLVPPTLVAEIVTTHAPPRRRTRLLPAEVTLLLVIAMNLFAADALEVVLAKLLLAPHLRWGEETIRLATKGAISQARQRLGIRPVAALFHRLCQPLATSATPGAFCCGLRLMAIDTTVEAVADTHANERAFGRHRGRRGLAGFPQILVAYLVECGTHAIVDVWLGPCHGSAPAGAQRLLRGVRAGMLLLVDSGLCHIALIRRVHLQGAHLLGRVGSTLLLTPQHGLPDGSYLARLYTAPPSRRGTTTPFLVVRVIVYTLTDAAGTQSGETYRLVTTLLDPVTAPARDLILAYHERWEIELTIDELDTHQRPVGRPLRSKTPQGVVQELYGLLIAHYLIRATMHEAACTRGLDPDRLSFTRALSLIITVLPLVPLLEAPMQEVLRLQVLETLLQVPLPPRDRRSNPRAVKRRLSKFPRRSRVPRDTRLHLPFVHAIALSPLGATLSFSPPPHTDRVAA